MKIARINYQKLRLLYLRDGLKNFPDPNSFPLWISLGNNLIEEKDIKKSKEKNSRRRKQSKGGSSSLAPSNNDDKSISRSSSGSGYSKRKTYNQKKKITLSFLKKLDLLLFTIKPKNDPRLLEASWVTSCNNHDDRNIQFKVMNRVQKDHFHVSRKYKKLKIILKSLDYHSLLVLFREDNFQYLMRTLKTNIKETESSVKKIDKAYSLIMKSLKKLKIADDYVESESNHNGTKSMKSRAYFTDAGVESKNTLAGTTESLNVVRNAESKANLKVEDNRFKNFLMRSFAGNMNPMIANRSNSFAKSGKKESTEGSRRNSVMVSYLRKDIRR